MNQLRVHWPLVALFSDVTLRLVALLFIFNGSCAIAASSTAGKDTAYRVSLYDYFQQNYFSAISELLIEQEKEKKGHEHMPSELLRAGIMVSYGMDQSAKLLLEELQSSEVSAENQARAAFYLGKLFYRKGEPEAAFEQFKAVDASLTPALHHEFHFLANTAMHQAGVANQQKELIDEKIKASGVSIWTYYNEFNQHISQLPSHCKNNSCEQNVDKEQVAKSIKGLKRLLDKIENSDLLDNGEELLALRDKVHTTLGFISLQAVDSRSAIAAFKNVRKTSPLVGQALLGYGWAASNADDMQKALSPWLQLKRRPIHEASTKEALLAVPYAFEKLSAFDQALAAYNEATHLLEQEIDLLTRLHRQVSSDEYYNFNHYLNNSALQWLNYRQLADIDHSPFKDDREAFERLQYYQTQKEYVSVSQQLADASWLKKRLLQWQSDLSVLKYAVEERRARALQAINPEYTQALKQRYVKLDAEYKQLRANANLGALTNEREREILERIQRAEKRVAILQRQMKNSISSTEALKTLQVNNASLAENSRLLSLMKGTLDWQVAQAHSIRKRQHHKSLHSIEKGLVDSNAVLEKIAKLEVDAVVQAAHTLALKKYGQQIAHQHLLAETLVEKLQQQLRELFSDEIERQMAQTKNYLAQAQMAKARLMDTLSLDSRTTSPLVQLTSNKPTSESALLVEQVAP